MRHRIEHLARAMALGMCVVLGADGTAAAAPNPEPAALSAETARLQARYATMLTELKAEIAKAIPPLDEQKKSAYLAACKAGKAEEVTKAADALNLTTILADAKLDAKLVKCVVLLEATPAGLAAFAGQGQEQARLIEQLLGHADLMRQMLVADGANGGQYGTAMKIYTDIQQASPKAGSGVLQQLALAIAVEHAVPIEQSNPSTQTDAPKTIDPVKRYAHYEKAFLDGELDPAFKDLTAWDLRFLVDGDEPDWMHAWGREMLRNYRPDHLFNPDPRWRYVRVVTTNVEYGSGRTKFDRPELQAYQNILMNGGICGRRAFFGRFILRCFGIPAIGRPSKGHGALAHWTPEGWVVNFGPGWGRGFTGVAGYGHDRDFLASSQARQKSEAFLQVKRAQWIGDVFGEPLTGKGYNRRKSGFWNDLSLRTQQQVIEQAKIETLAAVGEKFAEADEDATIAEQVISSAVIDADKEIGYAADGAITIPAAAYSTTMPRKDIITMKSFAGGLQIYLERFGRSGLTLLRGGGYKSGPGLCGSGFRLQSSGYGSYDNWGFRAALTPTGQECPPTLKLDLGNGVAIEFVYIKPGTFMMGGVRDKGGKYECVELPKHEVTITKGFYLGKYEVTQGQYAALMGGSTDEPNLPIGAGEGEAVEFCNKLCEKTGQMARLPTEAEWEYAARAGTTADWFFGDDPAPLGDYAWCGSNSDTKKHPVGQKMPNPWGLYDIYGNVFERVSDVYKPDYYANSAKEDPAGPIQAPSSCFQYTINVPQAGKYALAAQVVTVNYVQRLNLSVNDDPAEIKVTLPFTCGTWQEPELGVLDLKQGANVLKFSRTNPPQYGIALKSFTLKPVK